MPQGPPLHIPPTVQGILAARIDRLAPDEKAFLQQLSVIGRQFPLSLIRHVITQPEADLYWLLASLQRKEFLYEQPAFPESEYVFKHALTQEVAYNSVLIERRKALHEQTGQAIEQLFLDRLEEHYAELAHHYSRGSKTEKAIEYLHKAGQQAVKRSAHAEATSHLTVALELLKNLPDTPERARRELMLLIALGVPLTSVRGYADTAVKAVYDRAYELCQHVGATPQLFTVLRGLRYFHLVGGEVFTDQTLGEELLRVAQRTQDQGFLLQAHFALGASLCLLGEFPLSRAHLEQSLTFYDSSKYRDHAFLYGQDPGTTCLSYLAWTLWFLGYPHQALQKIHEALALSQELTHPYSQAFVLCCASMLHQYRREEQLGRERAEGQIAIGSEQGFPYWLTLGSCYQSWALAEQGQAEEGIVQLRQSMTAFRATGTEMFRPYLFALLAGAYRKTGQLEEGAKAVAEGLAAAGKTGERFWEAELYRLKGELTLQQQVKVESQKSQVPNTQHLTPGTQAEADAEACFLKAIAIAQKQQAKSLELRAVMSLARLWQNQGKIVEARQRLAEIDNWFTEGFDTKDLQEAKALLDSLGSRV